MIIVLKFTYLHQIHWPDYLECLTIYIFSIHLSINTTSAEPNIYALDCSKFLKNCTFTIKMTAAREEGGAVAQSAERSTPGEEVPGSIPAVAARSLLVGSVSV